MGSLLHCLLLLLAGAGAASSRAILRIVPRDAPSAAGSDDGNDLYCDSWRLAVEANNARDWTQVPARCEGYVEAYMNGAKYASDSDVVADEALAFAKSVKVGGDGKDVWVFDIDETLLSNLPFYAEHGYGSNPYNETLWNEWECSAKAPALPASLRLYNKLLRLGFQMVLLTGRQEVRRNFTEKNLLLAGYQSWERLILRQESDNGKPAVVYKSEKRAELEAQGYRIHGSSGDQWSDLLGMPMARRSFKLPNPLYYIE